MTSPAGARVRARLFDADRQDERLEPETALDTRPSDRQLLWIDLAGDVATEDVTRLGPLLDLRPRTLRAIARPRPEPYVAIHRDYVHVRVAADPSEQDADGPAWLDIIAGRNVVITHHDRDVGFLDHVDTRIEGDATAGELSAPAFFTILVEGTIASYHAAVDAIEEDVDDLDAMLLRGTERRGVLRDLVHARRRIARLRHLLADHRAVFTTLSSPELKGVVDDPDDAALIAGLASQYGAAMSAVDEAREALLGSFDVYMSQTGQRTNEVMKVLTIATVLLLPGSMIAGLLGMNVIVPLNKDDPMSFWMVIVAIGVLAAVIIGVARARHWL